MDSVVRSEGRLDLVLTDLARSTTFDDEAVASAARATWAIIVPHFQPEQLVLRVQANAELPGAWERRSYFFYRKDFIAQPQ